MVITPNGEEVYVAGLMGLKCYNIENDSITQISTGKIFVMLMILVIFSSDLIKCSGNESLLLY